jgi:hypothetical protein
MDDGVHGQQQNNTDPWVHPEHQREQQQQPHLATEAGNRAEHHAQRQAGEHGAEQRGIDEDRQRGRENVGERHAADRAAMAIRVMCPPFPHSTD